MLLAHLSDAHIGPIPRPKLRELMGKRATGYANWLHKRSRLHDMGLLARLVEDLLAQRPDHVAMTGDVVNIGLPAEIAAARQWLAGLGSPSHVSFSPGNHDAYVPGAMPLLEETFAPWTTGDDGVSGFPYLRRRSGVALIGLTSGVPTAPFVASGRLGAEQCARLESLLEMTKREGLARVVMIHHPPHCGGARPLRGLEDAESFEAAIARQGAELVLHGHNHAQSLHFLPGPQGRAPVVGVASASARQGSHYPAAAYHLYEIARDGDRISIQVRTRGISETGEEIVELGGLQDSALVSA
ncbi:metallophosphoesterase family protein [Methylocystis bryophila]|uniref:Metallophosphatase n=1 Tax=Methylocystis bryophila TaxID=655015 RepID=A0A1W6MZ53_9HYPH|nr:metallophosphoesterase [Methylocystis bryophila]ARN82855.1 metallophosphatase [Methylocystis bryophila]BDV39115.1 metallophosphoesterase [Methylocystis bryophila]